MVYGRADVQTFRVYARRGATSADAFSGWVEGGEEDRQYAITVSHGMGWNDLSHAVRKVGLSSVTSIALATNGAEVVSAEDLREGDQLVVRGLPPVPSPPKTAPSPGRRPASARPHDGPGPRQAPRRPRSAQVGRAERSPPRGGDESPRAESPLPSPLAGGPFSPHAVHPDGPSRNVTIDGTTIWMPPGSSREQFSRGQVSPTRGFGQSSPPRSTSPLSSRWSVRSGGDAPGAGPGGFQVRNPMEILHSRPSSSALVVGPGAAPPEGARGAASRRPRRVDPRDGRAAAEISPDKKKKRRKKSPPKRRRLDPYDGMTTEEKLARLEELTGPPGGGEAEEVEEEEEEEEEAEEEEVEEVVVVEVDDDPSLFQGLLNLRVWDGVFEHEPVIAHFPGNLLLDAARQRCADALCWMEGGPVYLHPWPLFMSPDTNASGDGVPREVLIDDPEKWRFFMRNFPFSNRWKRECALNALRQRITLKDGAARKEAAHGLWELATNKHYHNDFDDQVLGALMRNASLGNGSTTSSVIECCASICWLAATWRSYKALKELGGVEMALKWMQSALRAGCLIGTDRDVILDDDEEGNGLGNRVEGMLREVFQECDRNKDGMLNRRELILALRSNSRLQQILQLEGRVFQEGDSRDAFESVFQAIDNDDSRDVTWQEFLSYVRIHMPAEVIFNLGESDTATQESPPGTPRAAPVTNDRGQMALESSRSDSTPCTLRALALPSCMAALVSLMRQQDAVKKLEAPLRIHAATEARAMAAAAGLVRITDIPGQVPTGWSLLGDAAEWMAGGKEHEIKEGVAGQVVDASGEHPGGARVRSSPEGLLAADLIVALVCGADGVGSAEVVQMMGGLPRILALLKARRPRYRLLGAALLGADVVKHTGWSDTLMEEDNGATVPTTELLRLTARALLGVEAGWKGAGCACAALVKAAKIVAAQAPPDEEMEEAIGPLLQLAGCGETVGTDPTALQAAALAIGEVANTARGAKVLLEAESLGEILEALVLSKVPVVQGCAMSVVGRLANNGPRELLNHHPILSALVLRMGQNPDMLGGDATEQGYIVDAVAGALMRLAYKCPVMVESTKGMEEFVAELLEAEAGTYRLLFAAAISWDFARRADRRKDMVSGHYLDKLAAVIKRSWDALERLHGDERQEFKFDATLKCLVYAVGTVWLLAYTPAGMSLIANNHEGLLDMCGAMAVGGTEYGAHMVQLLSVLVMFTLITTDVGLCDRVAELGIANHVELIMMNSKVPMRLRGMCAAFVLALSADSKGYFKSEMSLDLPEMPAEDDPWGETVYDKRMKAVTRTLIWLMSSDEPSFVEIGVRGTAILAMRHKEIGRLGAVDALHALLKAGPDPTVMTLGLKALLNLSCSAEIQVLICNAAADSLLDLASGAWVPFEDPQVADDLVQYSSAVLYNLHKNPANHTRLYRAELARKAQAIKPASARCKYHKHSHKHSQEARPAVSPASAMAAHASRGAAPRRGPCKVVRLEFYRPQQKAMVDRAGAVLMTPRGRGPDARFGDYMVTAAQLEVAQRAGCRVVKVLVTLGGEDDVDAEAEEEGEEKAAGAGKGRKKGRRFWEQFADGGADENEARMINGALHQYLRRPLHDMWAPVEPEDFTALTAGGGLIAHCGGKGGDDPSPWQPPVGSYKLGQRPPSAPAGGRTPRSPGPRTAAGVLFSAGGPHSSRPPAPDHTRVEAFATPRRGVNFSRHSSGMPLAPGTAPGDDGVVHAPRPRGMDDTPLLVKPVPSAQSPGMGGRGRGAKKSLPFGVVPPLPLGGLADAGGRRATLRLDGDYGEEEDMRRALLYDCPVPSSRACSTFRVNTPRKGVRLDADPADPATNLTGVQEMPSAMAPREVGGRLRTMGTPVGAPLTVIVQPGRNRNKFQFGLERPEAAELGKMRAAAEGGLSARERAERQAAARENFEVPRGGTHMKLAAARAKGHLVVFDHIPGSEACCDLFKHYLLPDGRLVHYYLSRGLIDEVTVSWNAPPPPIKLSDLGQEELPDAPGLDAYSQPPAGGWTLPPEGFHWVGESGVEQKPDPEPEDDGRGGGKYASFYGKPIKGFREGAVGPVPTGERTVPVVVEEWPTGELKGGPVRIRLERPRARSWITWEDPEIARRIHEEMMKGPLTIEGPPPPPPPEMLPKDHWRQLDWILDSQFAPRQWEEPMCGLMDPDEVFHKAAHKDWERCCAKARFRRLCGGERCLPDVEAVVMTNHRTIWKAYDYYASLGFYTVEDTMDLNEYTLMLEEVDIPDNALCNRAVCDTIFTYANFEEGDKSTYENRNNPDRQLLRFELIEALLRVARAKFLQTGIADTLAEAFEKLAQYHLSMLPPPATLEPNDFRDERLYTREVDSVLRAYEPLLRAVFLFYRGARRQRLTSHQWVRLMRDGGLLPISELTGCSKREAMLCFRWSRIPVEDEIKNRAMSECLCYTSFLEALGRLADVISPPPIEDILALSDGLLDWGHEHCLDEMTNTERNVALHRITYDYYMLQKRSHSRVNKQKTLPRRRSAALMSEKTRSLAEKVEQVLELMMWGLCDTHGVYTLGELQRKLDSANAIYT